MYLITKEEKQMLEAYKAIGRPEEIIRRLDHPFPEAEDGYAPLPPMTPREMPMRVGGQCLAQELIQKPWRPSGLSTPDYQPVFIPMTSEQRTVIDRIIKSSITPKPDSGLLAED